MACGCSEHEESSGTHCLVYTIGTEDAFYRMIEATLPPEPGPYGNPTVSRDGSLHFPGDHPDILGYDRTGHGSFRPSWPNCQWRVLSVDYPDGCLMIQGQCHHVLSDHHLAEVTPACCENCQLRSPIPSRQ